MFDIKRLLLPVVVSAGLVGCGSGGGGTDEFPTGSTGSDKEITDGDSGTPSTPPPNAYSVGVFKDFTSRPRLRQASQTNAASFNTCQAKQFALKLAALKSVSL